MQLIIDEIQPIKHPHHQTITISYKPDNLHAKYIYEKAGFFEIPGLVIESEQVARYTF